MLRKKPDVDIILDILEDFLQIYPESPFVKSLMAQYRERGSLSRKQLEGLYFKAVDIKKIAPNKLATLEAVIKKKAEKFRSAAPPPTPLYQRDPEPGKKINEILARYPEHKRVIFLQTKYENNEVLSASELTELDKFHRLLVK